MNIPKGLPECDLVRVLANKAAARKDTDFQFLAELDSLRKRVSGEVRHINGLFPEYTPHDEEYHLKPLFHIADTVLGGAKLEEMNSGELFVLAASLYGHDWGMAVSEAERDFILQGRLSEGVGEDDLWIVRDERGCFAKFAREQGLEPDKRGFFGEVPVEVWREYVRRTHAVRSARRVERYFQAMGGVADAVSRVCEGHWVEFEDLQNETRYPANFPLLRETANLRAVALYVRLIDLFDLGEDRTPYVIWKFVAPRDPGSKMEWDKHRALRPVTCTCFQDERVVRVEGSTDDHEVYAALEDLRIFCEEQLKGSNDLLRRMNDQRHRVAVHHLDWRVAARGFEPVSIRFEFDRESMFDVLSDEIYRGDRYVFLRELLQNSIDAIRMRREVLRREGIEDEKIGVIRVTVEHAKNGDAVVAWHDDGIGMDEYVVRNYLAVAGKSYYRSGDFERLGLTMDPISRFGVGILSCFMVADRVEIETFKEPYLPPSSEPLRIVIPAVQRLFRIEKLVREGVRPGTVVRVFVQARKMRTDDECGGPRALDVTGYLRAIAGFVEFPILINEGDRRTVVLHPKQDAVAARERFGDEFEVHQLDLSYPWDEVILPQDLDVARRVLREQRFDIASDLRVEGYDGALTYLVPKDDRVAVLNRGGHESEFVLRGPQKESLARVRSGGVHGYRVRRAPGLSPSAPKCTGSVVYRDGILLASAPPAESWLGVWSKLPFHQVVVNLLRPRGCKVDLSRTRMLREAEPWDRPIFRGHVRTLSESVLKELVQMSPAERLFQLGRFISLHRIPADSVWEVFPHERWPLPFLEPGGRLAVLEWGQLREDRVCFGPEFIYRPMRTLSDCQWITEEAYDGPLVAWAGERCLLKVLVHPYEENGASAAILCAQGLWELPIQSCYEPAAARFLQPPWEGDPRLFQEVWKRRRACENPPGVKVLLGKAREDPGKLTVAEAASLWERFEKLRAGFPQLLEFGAPFADRFGYGMKVLNIAHPAAQGLIRVAAALELARMEGALKGEEYGRMEDALHSVPSSGWDFTDVTSDRVSKGLRRVWSLAQELRLVDVGHVDEITPRQEEFVTGTIVTHKEQYGRLLDLEIGLRDRRTDTLFGQPLL